MSIFYKNQGFKQVDTSKATVLTCPTDGSIIVKSIYCANNDASSSIVVNMNFVDSSDSNTEYEFFRDDVPAKSQVNATPQGLNLEAGDAITVQAATGSSKTDNIIKIDCTTITTWRNTKTNEVFKEKKEGPDIVQDVTVQVSPKGLDMIQKAMNNNDNKSKT